jgi:hypothetical protein
MNLVYLLVIFFLFEKEVVKKSEIRYSIDFHHSVLVHFLEHFSNHLIGSMNLQFLWNALHHYSSLGNVDLLLLILLHLCLVEDNVNLPLDSENHAKD